MPMGPIGGALNLDASLAGLQMPSVMAQAQPKAKGGMFAGADWGSALQALIGGALASRGNPGGAFMLQMLNQKRQAAMEAQSHQQEREEGFQDFVRKEAYRAANPGAPDPTAFQKDYAWYLQNNPKLADQFATAHAATGGSPFGSLFTDKATGQQYMMGGGQQQAGPQPGQVEDGFQYIGGDPSDQNNWKPAGGPTPQASGGFPRSY